MDELDLRAVQARLAAPPDAHSTERDVLALLAALRALRHAGQLVVKTLGTEDTVVQELADELARVRDDA